MCLFSKTPILTLRPNQLAIQCILGFFHTWLKQSVSEFDHSSPTSAEDKNKCSCISTLPIACKGRGNLMCSLPLNFQSYIAQIICVNYRITNLYYIIQETHTQCLLFLHSGPFLFTLEAGYADVKLGHSCLYKPYLPFKILNKKTRMQNTHCI